MWSSKQISILNHLGLIVSKCSKVGIKIWFKWTKYSDQTNFEPKVLYEWNQGNWNVFRIRFTWSKYLGVAAFLRHKYRNSLVMKIYKRRSHHVTCLANMADTVRYVLTYSYNLHLGIMIQISEWGWIWKRWFNTKFTPHILVLHIRVKKWFKWTHIVVSNDWYNTFGVMFMFKPRYLVQTWTWNLWYNQAQQLGAKDESQIAPLANGEIYHHSISVHDTYEDPEQ